MHKFNYSQEDIKLINKFFPKGLVAFDLETSGLSPLVDEIIEISAIKIIYNRIEYFDTLIKPTKLIPQYTIDIHGITDEMVKDSPSISEVLPKFIEFAKEMTWVAHNAKFDVGFIVYNMHQQSIPFFKSDVFCSCKLSRRFVKNSENHKLVTLAKLFEVKLENHHRAMDDSYACLKVFSNTLKLVKSNRALLEGRACNIRDYRDGVESEIPENVKGIRAHLEKQNPVMIKYKGGSMNGQFRPIRPISFLPLPDGSVLYAHCLKSDMYKSFSLKKIQDFRELTDEEREQINLLKEKYSEPE